MTQIVDAISFDPAGAVPDALGLWLVLSLPAFVLLLLVALLIWSRRRRRAARQMQGVLDASPGMRSDGREGMHVKVGGGADAPVRSDPRQEIERLEATLKTATTTEQQTALAPVYLQLARQYFAAGDEDAFLTALRQAAGLASLHGPLLVHAEARLELAAAALRAGDTTGACEQWQMARIAFEQLGEDEAHDRVDKLMRDNGCPTDWVLTDF